MQANYKHIHQCKRWKMKEDEDDNEDEDGDIKDVHWEALEEVHQVAPSGKTALRAHICTLLHCTTLHYTTLHCMHYSALQTTLHCIHYSAILSIIWKKCTARSYLPIYVYACIAQHCIEQCTLHCTIIHIRPLGGRRITSQYNMAFFTWLQFR